MAVEIDGFLYEWGDRVLKVKVRARPATNPLTSKRKKAAAAPKPSKPPKPASGGRVRASLERLARRTPEVMVKITVGRKDPETGKRNVLCKDMGAIKAHMDYISRNGEVPLEDEHGNQIHGAKELARLRNDWQFSGGYDIPEVNGYRREAYSVVLSMPPGTDRASVKRAARDFARENFSNHQWVFAQHDDEEHPHVHLCVRSVGHNLVRLNPRKNDLQLWRESFAEKLRDHGIEANATPRDLRGRAQRAERQEVQHIVGRGAESRALRGRREDIQQAARAGGGIEHPAEPRIRGRRKRIVTDLGEVASALARAPSAEDKRLAMALAKHVSEMPPAKSAHRVAVDLSLSGRGGEGRAAPAAPEKDRDRSK